MKVLAAGSLQPPRKGAPCLGPCRCYGALKGSTKGHDESHHRRARVRMSVFSERGTRSCVCVCVGVYAWSNTLRLSKGGSLSRSSLTWEFKPHYFGRRSRLNLLARSHAKKHLGMGPHIKQPNNTQVLVLVSFCKGSFHFGVTNSILTPPICNSLPDFPDL